MFNFAILKGHYETVCCNLQALLAICERIVTRCDKWDLPDSVEDLFKLFDAAGLMFSLWRTRSVRDSPEENSRLHATQKFQQSPFKMNRGLFSNTTEAKQLI